MVKLKKIKLQNDNKNLKTFTLLEVVVSIAIISIILLLLVQTLIFANNTIIENYILSKAREDIDLLISLMSKDIKNAEKIINCINNECSFLHSSKIFKWSKCENEMSVCKFNENNQVIYETNLIKINVLDFNTIRYNNSYEIVFTLSYSIINKISGNEPEFIQQFTTRIKNYKIF